MSKYNNVPTKEVDDKIQALRGAIVQRATWFYLLVDEARKSGITDWAAYGKRAISRYGDLEAEHKWAKKVDKSDIADLTNFFGNGVAPAIFEQKKSCISAEKFEIEFHYCPFLVAWEKMNVPTEDIQKLCEIVHSADARLVEGYLDGIKMQLGKTMPKGDDFCQIQYVRK